MNSAIDMITPSQRATSDAYVRAFVDVLRDFDYFDSDAELEK